MNNVDNTIYHALKIVHRNVVSLLIYTSHTESDHMQLFLLDATSKDSWQYVTWQVKAKSNKQTKNLWIYFESVYGIIYLLRIWYLEENTVSPSYLHIHGFNQWMENIWK